LLLHLIDTAEQSGRAPLEDYQVIMEELRSFSPVVADKPMLLIASRIDAAGTGERLSALRKFCRARNMALVEISSVTGVGLEELKQRTWAMLEQIPKRSGDREIG
jgi:GTP-binding protein